MITQPFKTAYSLLKNTVDEFLHDKVLKLSAALAYYTVFSLPPMLILIIALCGTFLGEEAIHGQIFGQIKDLVGNQAALQIEEVIKNIHLEKEGTFATIMGVGVLVISATGIFGEIQDSINQIWGLRAKPSAGLWKLIKNRLLSFSLIVSLGFVLLVSLMLNALITVFSENVMSFLPEAQIDYLLIINSILIFSVITLLFAVIFKVLPDAHIRWREVWIGAIVTAVLFMAGKFLIGYFLSNNETVSAYGAAGSVILILLWVYYSATILFIGAEFTQVYANSKGNRIRPSKYAVWIEKIEVEKQLNTDVHDKKD